MANEAQQLKRSFETYVDDIRKEADRVIHLEFPRKVNHLRELFRTNAIFSRVHSSRDVRSLVILDSNQSEYNSSCRPTKKRRADESVVDGPQQDSEQTDASSPQVDKGSGTIYTQQVSTNPTVLELIGIVKPEILQMVELCGKVKSWIQLNIPRIEDGHNLGVSIQEEIVKELMAAEDSAIGITDSIQKYFVRRAKLATKCIKYPNVEDYREALHQLDEMEWLHLRMTCSDLTLNYAVLFDRIMKNWERIEKPRPADSHMTMY